MEGTNFYLALQVQFFFVLPSSQALKQLGIRWDSPPQDPCYSQGFICILQSPPQPPLWCPLLALHDHLLS